MNEIMQPGTGTGTATAGYDKYTGADVILSRNKYYWPSNTGWILNFYGFAPENAAVTPDLANEKLPITYTVKTRATGATGDAQEDFTIAIPKSYTAVPERGNVHNQFKHMLTKISIATPVLTEELKKIGRAHV